MQADGENSGVTVAIKGNTFSQWNFDVYCLEPMSVRELLLRQFE